MADESTEVDDVELAKELDQEPLPDVTQTANGQLNSDNMIFDVFFSRCPPG